MTNMLEQVRREHRRIAILRHLEGSAQYRSNVSILVDVANGVGIPSSRDQTVGEVTWLKDQGLVITDGEGDVEFMVVEATGSGVEVALGRATYPGIKRPSAAR